MTPITCQIKSVFKVEFLQEFFHELRWSKFPYATPFRPPPLPPPPARPCEAGGIKVYHNRFYARLTATKRFILLQIVALFYGWLRLRASLWRQGKYLWPQKGLIDTTSEHCHYSFLLIFSLIIAIINLFCIWGLGFYWVKGSNLVLFSQLIK